MDPDKIPNGWTIVPDTDNTDVTINWGGQKSPSVLSKTDEGITVLAIIVLLIGITIVFRKKIKNKK